MAETTAISWTDATFNPWIGCAKVSPGCDHCYAEVSTPSRTMKISWGAQQARKRTSTSNWQLPVRWNNLHDHFSVQHGRRRRVFCASLADVFDNRVDPQWRNDLWTLVRSTPNLDWLILTKRISNVVSMLPLDWGDGYGNVWLGISVVNQVEAERDIPKLLATSAKVRWLSMEPLLEAVTFDGLFSNPNNMRHSTNVLEELNWVVLGGESGVHARQLQTEWVETIRDQCSTVDVPFFFKQWGGSTKDKGGCALNGIEVKTWPITSLS